MYHSINRAVVSHPILSVHASTAAMVGQALAVARAHTYVKGEWGPSKSSVPIRNYITND